MTESDIQKPKPEILWIGKYVQMCSLLTCIDGSSIDVPEGLRPIIEFSSRKQSDKKASSPSTIHNIEKETKPIPTDRGIPKLKPETVNLNSPKQSESEKPKHADKAVPLDVVQNPVDTNKTEVASIKSAIPKISHSPSLIIRIPRKTDIDSNKEQESVQSPKSPLAQSQHIAASLVAATTTTAIPPVDTSHTTIPTNTIESSLSVSTVAGLPKAPNILDTTKGEVRLAIAGKVPSASQKSEQISKLPVVGQGVIQKSIDTSVHTTLSQPEIGDIKLPVQESAVDIPKPAITGEVSPSVSVTRDGDKEKKSVVDINQKSNSDVCTPIKKEQPNLSGQVIAKSDIDSGIGETKTKESAGSKQDTSLPNETAIIPPVKDAEGQKPLVQEGKKDALKDASDKREGKDKPVVSNPVPKDTKSLVTVVSDQTKDTTKCVTPESSTKSDGEHPRSTPEKATNISPLTAITTNLTAVVTTENCKKGGDTEMHHDQDVVIIEDAKGKKESGSKMSESPGERVDRVDEKKKTRIIPDRDIEEPIIIEEDGGQKPKQHTLPQPPNAATRGKKRLVKNSSAEPKRRSVMYFVENEAVDDDDGEYDNAACSEDDMEYGDQDPILVKDKNGNDVPFVVDDDTVEYMTDPEEDKTFPDEKEEEYKSVKEYSENEETEAVKEVVHAIKKRGTAMNINNDPRPLSAQKPIIDGLRKKPSTKVGEKVQLVKGSSRHDDEEEEEEEEDEEEVIIPETRKREQPESPSDKRDSTKKFKSQDYGKRQDTKSSSKHQTGISQASAITIADDSEVDAKKEDEKEKKKGDAKQTDTSNERKCQSMKAAVAQVIQELEGDDDNYENDEDEEEDDEDEGKIQPQQKKDYEEAFSIERLVTWEEFVNIATVSGWVTTLDHVYYDTNAASSAVAMWVTEDFDFMHKRTQSKTTGDKIKQFMSKMLNKFDISDIPLSSSPGISRTSSELLNKNGESRNSNSVNPSRGTTARSTTTTKKNSTMSSSSGLSSETTGMTGSSDWSTRSGHDGMTDRRDRQPPTNGTGQILFRQNTMMARADVANTVNIQESNCLHRLLHKTLCSASITCWMAPSGASDDACVCTAAPGTLLSPQNVVLTTLTSTDNVVDTYILPVAIAGLLYVAFYSMRCDYMIGEAPFVLEWAEKYSNEIRDTKSKITKRPSDFVSDNMENIKLLWTQWKAIITEFVNITKKIPIR